MVVKRGFPTVVVAVGRDTEREPGACGTPFQVSMSGMTQQRLPIAGWCQTWQFLRIPYGLSPDTLKVHPAISKPVKKGKAHTIASANIDERGESE